MGVHPGSYLFVTLDSCRYDTFEAARIPVMRRLGPLHRAMAPGYLTYTSHMAMFMGFTPGIGGERTPFVNPKFAKVFKMAGGGSSGAAPAHVSLQGANVVQGFKKLGYLTLGTGALGWFDPGKETCRVLIQDFDQFWYAGEKWKSREQVGWLLERIGAAGDRPVFAFLNVGETHVPYYYEGAPWSSSWDDNPCVPFGKKNDAAECRRRQTACLEFLDSSLEPLFTAFEGASTMVCADHGDAWGEDGVWEHGIHHPKVVEVPLVLRLRPQPVPGEGVGARLRPLVEKVKQAFSSAQRT